jgi:hypothetical protein
MTVRPIAGRVTQPRRVPAAGLPGKALIVLDSADPCGALRSLAGRGTRHAGHTPSNDISVQLSSDAVNPWRVPWPSLEKQNCRELGTCSQRSALWRGPATFGSFGKYLAGASQGRNQTSHEKFTARSEPEENRPLQCGTTQEVAHDPQEADPRVRALIARGVYCNSTRCVQCERGPHVDRSDPQSCNTAAGRRRFRGCASRSCRKRSTFAIAAHR